MATPSLQLVRRAGSRGDSTVQQRLNLIIAQVGIAAAAADSLIGAGNETKLTERERQCADCMPVVLDDLRVKLEELAGDLERLEREAQS